MRKDTELGVVFTAAQKILFIIASLILGAVIVGSMSGCVRRSMEGDFIPETALIPVHIDWSKSGVKVEEMHRASVLLYPEDGSTLLDYKLEGNLTDKEIQVPIGVYSVIVFNETTDPTDWKSIDFTDKDSYQKFAAVALPVTSRGFYSRADDLPLIDNPEPLAAWSLDKCEVTKEVLLRSRSRSRSSRADSRAEEVLDEQIAGLSNIVPTPRIETMTITARVENLSSAMQATGVLNGMSSGVYMASGEKMTTTGAHTFILNGREYDDTDDDGESDDGTTTKTFNIFGRQPADAHVDLYLDFLLTDGTLFPRQSFDVTNMIERDTEAIPVSNSILVGMEDRDPDSDDHEIILPDLDVKAGSVTVGEWEDVIVPMK
jgi:hypothetical protein